MRLKNKIISSVALFAVTAVMLTDGVFAAAFEDLPESHWAFNAIVNVSEKGYITGDSTGNFKPNDYIDSFKLSSALAKAAGYTAEYSGIYEIHKDYINKFTARYESWDSSVNSEIAYLLHKGIYIKEDLFSFCRTDGETDKLSTLSKEQLCVFLVRLINRESEALTEQTPTEPFSDDNQISEKRKPHVYHMKSLGLISSDATGKFNPKGIVSKAVAAAMLNSVLPLVPVQDLFPNVQEAGETSQASVMVQGSILGTYPPLRAILIKSDEGFFNNRVFYVSNSASVTVNKSNSDFSSLKQGMAMTFAIQDNIITAVDAGGSSSNIGGANVGGTVKAKKTLGTQQVIELQTGNAYNLSKDCKIVKDGQDSLFIQIKTGDSISIKVLNNEAVYVEIGSTSASVAGVVAGIISDMPKETIIVVADFEGTFYEFSINPISMIFRNSKGAGYSDLRVNDEIDVTVKNFGIERLDARESNKSTDSQSNMINDVLNSAKGTIYSAGASMFTLYSNGVYETFKYDSGTAIVGAVKLSVGMKIEISYTKLHYAKTIIVA